MFDCKLITYTLRLFWLTAKNFYLKNYSYQASALAFVTIISLIPFLSIMVYLSTFFIDLSQLLVMVNHYLYSSFLPGPINTIQIYLTKFTQQASELPILSIAFSFVTGVILISTVENALNQIWHGKINKKNPMMRILSWITLLSLPFIIGLSVFLSEYFASLLVDDVGKRVLLFLFGLLTNNIVIAISYLAISAMSIKWLDGWICGLIVAILLEVSKLGFVYYIPYFTNYTFIYGALAAIPAFFVWIYLVWCIFLYGALFIYTKHEASHDYHVKHKKSDK